MRERLVFKAHSLRPGEAVEAVWAAGVPWVQEDNFRGRLAKHGGKLVLTNQRLLFEPLRTPAVGREGRAIAAFAEGRRALDLEDVATVEPFSEKAPARIRIELDDGDSLVLGIPESRLSPMWSRKAGQRDDAVERIRAAIGGSSG